MEKVEVLDLLVKRDGIIDKEAVCTVGMLCDKIDSLKKHEKLDSELYKDIAKSVIYEQSRTLKKLIKNLNIPSIKFIKKDNHTSK